MLARVKQDEAEAGFDKAIANEARREVPLEHLMMKSVYNKSYYKRVT